MATLFPKHRSIEPTPDGLGMIARDATRQIVPRITSHRDLVSAMHTTRCVLKLELDTGRVEVHHGDGPTSEYCGNPLAVVSHEDLQVEQRNV